MDNEQKYNMIKNTILNHCTHKACNTCEYESKPYCEYLIAYEKGKEDALFELFNTPVAGNENTLRTLYEMTPTGAIDEGWDQCFEMFEEQAEKIRRRNGQK